jgi:hypothetical protein
MRRSASIWSLETRAGSRSACSCIVNGESILTRLVANLVDNAVRHNQPGGWIQVTTTADHTIGRLRLGRLPAAGELAGTGPGRRRKSRLVLDGQGDVELDLAVVHRHRGVGKVRHPVGSQAPRVADAARPGRRGAGRGRQETRRPVARRASGGHRPRASRCPVPAMS